jgi:N-acetyl-anhydromuramyl-L-alanine amidase AmpD
MVGFLRVFSLSSSAHEKVFQQLFCRRQFSSILRRSKPRTQNQNTMKNKTHPDPIAPRKGAILLQKLPLTIGSAIAAVGMTADGSTDYGPARWTPNCGQYSTSGYGHKFHVTHDMEGYYASTVSFFQRCSTTASVTYLINAKKDYASDYAAGDVTQMVRDSYYAFHAICWNHHSTGTEHEGFAGNAAWYTEAQYSASAGVVRHLQAKFGWAMDRNHVIAHGQKSVSGWPAYASAHLGINPYCNTHTDPGPYWKWSHYMDLCKGTTSTPSAPSSLVATTVSTSQIKLTWKDNSGTETGFKVERSTSPTSGFGQIATPGANATTYTSGGLASGTTYYYRVRAYNASGNSGYSGVAHAMTKDTIPAAPTSLTATAVSDVQINLAWAQSMPNEDGFHIYRSTDNVTYALVATVGINATSYSNTGLAGNRLYYYKVAAYNTAGNSAYSNVASDTTAPQAPGGLTVSAVAGTTNWNRLQLAWTDNSAAEVGFKVERATVLAGPYSQINTTAAGVNNYQDSNLAATTTYYYRVRSYNGNGNSAYSAVASRATGNAPPVLTAIGDKTVAAGTALTFTATASDPNAPAASTAWTGTFEGTADGTEEQMFRKPGNSGSTSQFVNTSVTNYSTVHTGGPSGVGGTKAIKASWNFKTGFANYWIRYNSGGAPTFPNPTIALDQMVRLRVYTTKALKVGIGVRETGTTAGYGADGGITGTVEWVGVTNVVGGVPIPNRLLAVSNWTTLSYNIPFEPQWAFTGDGKVNESGAKGTLEHIVLNGAGGTGTYTIWVDDISIIIQNYKTYSLDAGAPSGATIGRRSGKFAWTPTTGQVGTYPITVRVTDNLGGQDFETITVTVTGTGNQAPVLAAIGNKTVNEGSALAFNATATDANGNTLTYSLDAGNPSGSSITTGGAFSWTPTEAQGPGSYPITVRVTDNGSPSSNDFETIMVTVNEANNAPVISSIANQTISKGGTMNATASATDSSDVPANSITYSVGGPAGITINPSTGAISWTSGLSDGGQTYQVTVTATDNGVPAKSASTTFTVTITDVNNPPTVNAITVNDYNPFAQFDELDDEGVDGHNNAALFRVPYFSSSTTAFLDSTSYSLVTNVFPQDDVNGSYQALYVQMNFLTGTVNPWCRLSTFTSSTWTNTYAYPNPTIDLGQHVRFKIWSDKSIKVALGIRETGTQNPLGFEGGTTGSIEWIGATSTGSPAAPVPTHAAITASNWTQMDFNLPAETITAFPGSGNGILAAGKGVLEHMAIVPNAGTGIYNIYVDDFEVLTVKSGGSITVNTLDTIRFTATATDPDLPAQDLSFSLGAGAPPNAVLDDASGAFEWTVQPDQSGTSVITVTATDNGSPVLSGSGNVTVIVNKINTPPRLAKMLDQVIENNTGGTVTFDASAEDDDLPGDTLTFSLTSAPAGATINPSTGTFSWTPPAGNSTNIATIRVTDNGAPSLWDEQTVKIVVVPANTAPTLSLGIARMDEPVVTFETFTNGTPNEAVMFKKPANSATTSSFVDTAATNYTSVTTSFPTGHSSAKVLRAQWSFKTGLTDYWIRLTTANATSLPNPTINASARLKFDVYSTKTLKIALGVRETGTAAENGANGGTTGTIEFVGASTKQANGMPNPTRTVNANTWTTLEFDLPNEPKVGFTGDGILTGGQQVLEHLALIGAGGSGAYTVYVDNFDVVTTSALPGTLTMKAGSTLTFTAGGTDPDPGSGLTFGMDADFTDLHTNATLDNVTGAFSWAPAAADVGTSTITVSVEDQPTNGGLPKGSSATFNIVVNADTLAPQSSADGAFVAGGDTATITWNSVAGATYRLEYKEAGGAWTAAGIVTAQGASSSVSVTNNGSDRYYRVVEAAGSSEE